MSNEYKTEQDSKNIILINRILDVMPSFAKNFFIDMIGSQGRSTRTILGYARDMELFFYYLSVSNPEIKEIKNISPEILEQLSPLDINEYLLFLTMYKRNGKMNQNSVAGKRRKLSALKSFWKWCVNYEVVKTNPTLLSSGPKMTKKNIIKLSEDEIDDVYQNIMNGTTLSERSKVFSQKTMLRDLAIVSLLLGTGIRVSECVGINLEDINFKDNSILIIRKGGNKEKVYFSNSVLYNLNNYINNERMQAENGTTALFLSRNQSRLSVRSVEKLVKKYVDSVALEHITPHKLRATFATLLYNRSHDIYLTQSALGHVQTQTTLHYAEIDEMRRKEVTLYLDDFEK